MGRILPILFNTDMVLAILDGRKTVTRRIVKFRPGQNPNWSGYVRDGLVLYNGRNEPCNRKAPYKRGDTLYVRETWSEWTGGYLYKAWPEPYPQPGESKIMTWHPSIHMPREAARIWLKVTDVRIERLQKIRDFRAEGIRVSEGCNECFAVCGECNPDESPIGCDNEIEIFADLWDSTVGKPDLALCGWEANPWIWVIDFQRCEKPKKLNEYIDGI